MLMKIWKYVKKAGQYISDRDYRFLINAELHLYDKMSDEEYIRRRYRAIFGKDINLENPQTISEKLQWIKLYDRRPLYTLLVDKYLVKQYVTERIGEKYVIPLIGSWTDPEEIDFDNLPNQFVLKCNHNSGTGMFICKNKSEIKDYSRIKRALRRGLKEDKYLLTREWPYKNVKRRIIAEKYMEDIETGELRDYKFFTGNGKVKGMFIASDRQAVNEETKFDFFDSDGHHLPFQNGHPNALITPKLPTHFEEMKQLAEVLARGIPEVRVDFYEANGQVYFGEMTFFHWSGFTPYSPEEWDLKLGSWIELPQMYFEEKE